MRAIRRDAADYLTGRSTGTPHPPGIGLPGAGEKFSTSGAVQVWPGNTFVCAVDPASEAFDQLRYLQEQVKRSEFAPLFTYLPPPSFHMTVFEGVSPKEHLEKVWLADLLSLGSRDAMTEAMVRDLRGLAVAPMEMRATGLYGAFSLDMAGVDEGAEKVFWSARNQIANAIAVRSLGTGYLPHITLAYPIQWMSAATARDVVSFSAEVFERVPALRERIPLGPCALCNFDTMHHFEPVLTLAPQM